MRLRGVLTVFVLVACLAPARAEIIDGYSSARNDRFVGATFPGNTPPTPNPTFYLPPAVYDFSGVGWLPAANGNGTFQVAMISPQDFIGAWHTWPNLQGNPNVNFLAKDGSSVSRTITGLTQIAGSDVLVGRLNTAVPTGAGGVAVYPISVGPESAFIGKTEYMFGQNGRVGRNLIGLFATADINFNGAGPTRYAISDFDPNINYDGMGYAQPSPTTDEFVVTGGDSGSPSFLFIDNQLSLLGPHSAQDNSGAPNFTPYGTADSFLSFYQTELSSSLSPGFTLGTFNVVPEPTSIALLGVPAVAWLWRRRRHAA